MSRLVCLSCLLLAACGGPLSRADELERGHEPAAEPCALAHAVPVRSLAAERFDLAACFVAAGRGVGRDASGAVGEVSYSITDWIPMADRAAEFVGFTLGASGELTYLVEAGQEIFQATTAGWSEPAALVGIDASHGIVLVALCAEAPPPRTPAESDAPLAAASPQADVWEAGDEGDVGACAPL